MKELAINLPELPYAVEEAMNRLRINIKPELFMKP